MKRLLLFPLLSTLLAGAEASRPAATSGNSAIHACIALEPKTADAQGIVWTYRATPFGVARYQEQTEQAAFVDDGTRATDAGDTVRFVRPGPFGTYRWERKKSDLSPSERAIWERMRDGGRD